MSESIPKAAIKAVFDSISGCADLVADYNECERTHDCFECNWSSAVDGLKKLILEIPTEPVEGFSYHELCVLADCIKRRCEQYYYIPPELLELHEKLIKLIKEQHHDDS